MQGLILEDQISHMVKAHTPNIPCHITISLSVLDKWDAVLATSTVSQESLLLGLSEEMFILLSEKDELATTSMATVDTPDVEKMPTVIIRDTLH